MKLPESSKAANFTEFKGVFDCQTIPEAEPLRIMRFPSSERLRVPAESVYMKKMMNLEEEDGWW